MMIWILSGIFTILTTAYVIYFNFNHGMSRSARGQQTRRMAVATLLAWLPMAAGWAITPFLVGGLWMVTYPLLFHLTNRRVSPDYENYADTTFGIYLIGLSPLSVCWPDLAPSPESQSASQNFCCCCLSCSCGNTT